MKLIRTNPGILLALMELRKSCFTRGPLLDISSLLSYTNAPQQGLVPFNQGQGAGATGDVGALNQGFSVLGNLEETKDQGALKPELIGNKESEEKDRISDVVLSSDERIELNQATDGELGQKFNSTLQKFGKIVGKGFKAITKSRALPLLSGKTELFEGASLPVLVTENPFIKEAMASDVFQFMQKKFPLSDLVSMLELKGGVVETCKKEGLDLNELVTPTQLFKALGIDPQRVAAELSKLQTDLVSGAKALAKQTSGAVTEEGASNQAAAQSPQSPKSPAHAANASAAAANPTTTMNKPSASAKKPKAPTHSESSPTPQVAGVIPQGNLKGSQPGMGTVKKPLPPASPQILKPQALVQPKAALPQGVGATATMVDHQVFQGNGLAREIQPAKALSRSLESSQPLTQLSNSVQATAPAFDPKLQAVVQPRPDFHDPRILRDSFFAEPEPARGTDEAEFSEFRGEGFIKPFEDIFADFFGKPEKVMSPEKAMPAVGFRDILPQTFNERFVPMGPKGEARLDDEEPKVRKSAAVNDTFDRILNEHQIPQSQTHTKIQTIPQAEISQTAVSEKLAEKTLHLASQGGGVAVVNLGFENQNDIVLGVKVVGDQVSVHIMSDSPERLIQHDVKGLADQLKHQNLDLVHFEFSEKGATPFLGGHAFQGGGFARESFIENWQNQASTFNHVKSSMDFEVPIFAGRGNFEFRFPESRIALRV